ncbi:MAG: response regulator [Deltaproteobacteria bacterium]|nr:response regulator [Deltaproteobacteria bacterium]
MGAVLIMDERGQSQALAAWLRADGHAVVQTATGSEAIEALSLTALDLVIVDLGALGAVDAAETCRRLRLTGAEDAPIVLLADADDPDAFERACAAGADDCLIKPVSSSEVRLRVRALLRTRELLRAERSFHETVRRQRDALDALSRQKDLLAAFLVHDLKSPLSSVSFALQNMLHDTTISGAARQSLELCEGANEAMHRMVLNLLDVFREGTIQPKLAQVDVEATLRGLERAVQARAERRRIAVDVQCAPGTIVADSELLRRTLDNLVDNALRYAPPRSTINLSAQPSGDGMLFRVADRGPGVPVNARERIFDRFIQLDAEPTARTSRGLGLAFCMIAVEAHGGRIWVDDNLPQGAAFCVLLPGTGRPA